MIRYLWWAWDSACAVAFAMFEDPEERRIREQRSQLDRLWVRSQGPRPKD